ncbi:hypothetical protein AA0Z99_08930 [Agrococcus sp. 1P02AA]|uniref:hypothetical protein n=1 Tax=Agrococcus sp. 1P02AA TaxID=3132259 RepID=UPI0039A4AEF0
MGERSTSTEGARASMVWAAAFAAEAADHVARSTFASDLPFSLVGTHVIDHEAIFVGRTQRGEVCTGVAVQTDQYAALFSWHVEAAAGAFVVELMEPGWAKGEPPSPAAIAWAEQHIPGIWWMATAPPPPEALDRVTGTA